MKIISADYVLTMNSNLDCIKDGAILIDGALIKQVGTLQELTQQYPEAAVTQYPKSLLMPGLINTHCHSGLLRGTAEGLPVWDWLQQFIDPMHRVVTPEDSKIASTSVMQKRCYPARLPLWICGVIWKVVLRPHSNSVYVQCWCPMWLNIQITTILKPSIVMKL